MLNTKYADIENEIKAREVIFTGPIDEYFDYCYGKLPYRSLRFEHQTHDCRVFQPAAVVNYPNEHAYTRVTEFKYLTGQDHAKTSIVYEYPMSEGDPYYPIPQPQNAELYARYKALADALPRVHFAGRLATYKYYNMDQVVAQALSLFSKLQEKAAESMPQQKGLVSLPVEIGAEEDSLSAQSGGGRAA
jgi:UDP-galactopyranose mutase